MNSNMKYIKLLDMFPKYNTFLAKGGAAKDTKGPVELSSFLKELESEVNTLGKDDIHNFTVKVFGNSADIMEVVAQVRAALCLLLTLYSNKVTPSEISIGREKIGGINHTNYDVNVTGSNNLDQSLKMKKDVYSNAKTSAQTGVITIGG